MEGRLCCQEAEQTLVFLLPLAETVTGLRVVSLSFSQPGGLLKAKMKLGATADIGCSDERAEMDRTDAAGAAGLVVCSLLSKTLRSLLCCPLIARIQLLSGDLEATRVELSSRGKLSLSTSAWLSLH